MQFISLGSRRCRTVVTLMFTLQNPPSRRDMLMEVLRIVTLLMVVVTQKEAEHMYIFLS